MRFNSLLSVDTRMLKTEGRILVAALKVFSRYSLETASLKMIADEAGVNLSNITYHFKTKENLYHEVLVAVLSYMMRDIEDRLEEMKSCESPSREDAS